MDRATPAAGSQNGHGPAPAAKTARVAAPPRRSRRALGIGLIIGATVLVLVASLGALTLRGGGGGAAAEVPPPISPVPAQAFTVLYNVQDSAGPDTKQQTDYLAVKRPYAVRLEHRDGPPPGGAVLTGSIVTQNDTVTLGGSGDGFTVPHPPAILPGVVSRQALDAAVEGGKAQRQGQSTVLGERCTHYIYDQFGNDPIGISDSQAKVDSCITPDDIMLREVIVFAGKTVRTAEAVKLDRKPVFGPDAFKPARVVLPDSAQQISDEIIEGAPRGAAKALTVQTPHGFTRDLAANVGHQVGPDVPPVLYYVQSYTGGGEPLIVEQPLDDSMGSPWSGRGGIKIDIGNGQPTIIIYRAGSVEIETKVGGLAVRVMALRKDLAIYVARQLKLPA
ncbi:MAG TPA: hypothetical protein VH134_04925 [Candidatus Dormibacteraeota bacterium]|nr:hypothetical protein [Candidatus Dormibacteraeota bacterium]